MYCENIHPNLRLDRVKEYDIFEVCPAIKPYVDQHNTPEANGIRNGKKDFKYDAIKHCYKVFAQCHMIRNSKADKIIFIDADKENYIKYYDLAFKLISSNGLILIDNVLWKGDVIDENKNDTMTNIIRDFNTHIKNDDKIEKTILPIGDGVTICRKL